MANICASVTCGGTTFPLRRERWFAPPWDRNLNVFVARVEIVIESGISNDAPLNLAWSKDGGHTFSSFVQMASGVTGAYTKRLYLNRIGRGRDWVFKVMADAAQPWYLIAATFDFEVGSS